MEASISLDIAEAIEIIRNHYKQTLGYSIDGVAISSWEQPLIVVQGDMLTHPIRHKLKELPL